MFVPLKWRTSWSSGTLLALSEQTPECHDLMSEDPNTEGQRTKTWIIYQTTGTKTHSRKRWGGGEVKEERKSDTEGKRRTENSCDEEQTAGVMCRGTTRTQTQINLKTYIQPNKLLYVCYLLKSYTKFLLFQIQIWFWANLIQFLRLHYINHRLLYFFNPF